MAAPSLAPQEAQGLQRVPADECRKDAWTKSGFVDLPSGAAEVKGGHNANIVDTNTAQGLQKGDIAAMRKEGATADDVVAALVAQSATFAEKSAYAQAKYIKKKREKYRDIDVLMLRPTAKMVADAYYAKSPLKVQGLRAETVAHMLSLANVQAGARVLAVDHARGLLCAAAMERMGGHGAVCAVSAGGMEQSIDAVRNFNFSREEAAVLTRATLAVLEGTEEPPERRRKARAEGDSTEGAAGAQQACEAEGGAQGGAQGGAADGQSAGGSQGAALVTDEADDDGEGSELPKVGSLLQRRATAAETSALREAGFTSVLVAAQALDPTALAKRLLPLCAPSAAIVFYAQYPQALAELMHWLTTEHMAVSLSLSETWVREQQVLPKRTHPVMSVQHVGGFVLSGFVTEEGASKATVHGTSAAPEAKRVKAEGGSDA